MKLRKLLLMFMILLIVVPLASAVNVAFSCSAVSPTQVDCTFSYAGNTLGAIPSSTDFDTGWAVSLNVNSGSYALAQSNFQNNPPSSTLLYNPTGNPQVNMVSVADLGPSGNFFVLRFTGVTTGSNTIVLNNIQLFDKNSNLVSGTTSTLSSTVTVGAAPPPAACTPVTANCNQAGVQCSNNVAVPVSRVTCGAPTPVCNLATGLCEAPSCNAPNTQCGAQCVNLQTSNANCGACSNACTAGQSCNVGICRPSCAPGSVCSDSTHICENYVCKPCNPGFVPNAARTSCVVAAPPSCTPRPSTPCVDGITCLSGTPSPSPRTGCPAGQSCQGTPPICQAVPPSPCASATWDCLRTVGSCAGVTVGDTLEFRQHRDCDLSNSACLSDPRTPQRPENFVLCPKSGSGAPTAAERLVGHMKAIAEGLQYPVDGSTVSPGPPNSNSATMVYNYKTLEDNPSTAILRKTAALARAIFGALTAT